MNNRMLRNIPLNTLLLDTCLVSKNKHTKAVTMNTEESEQIEKKKNQQNTLTLVRKFTLLHKLCLLFHFLIDFYSQQTLLMKSVLSLDNDLNLKTSIILQCKYGSCTLKLFKESSIKTFSNEIQHLLYLDLPFCL